MRGFPGGRRMRAHLVTEAQRPKSQDISHRERRYLIMMAVRLVCFLAAIVLFVRGVAWLALIAAVGAVIIPYIAVVFANAGREPNRARGLHDHQPHLSQGQQFTLPRSTARPHIVGYVTHLDSDHAPESRQNDTGGDADHTAPPEPGRAANS